jgi:hypothetical protein
VGAGIFKRRLTHFCYESLSWGWNRLPVSIVSPLTIVSVFGEGAVSINSESDRAASLVIGPTSLGMVRVYIESEGIELPMDFEPAEALEIANELRAAAEQAAAMVVGGASETGHGNGRNGKRGRKSGSKDGSGGRRG